MFACNRKPNEFTAWNLELALWSYMYSVYRGVAIVYYTSGFNVPTMNVCVCVCVNSEVRMTYG